jgi:hypothetical protein
MLRGLMTATVLLFAALPATSNYKLNSYEFGSGGTANSQTTTYSLEGTSGTLSGSPSSTANATVKPGYVQTQQAHVPQLLSLDNNSGQYYNKLHFVLDNQNNPTDATFLISVSTDNFATNTQYLHPDGTISTTLNLTDYQTYAAWGGSSGSLVTGLNPSTTYYVRVKATQGKFTESAYGPISSQATAAPTISFSLATSAGPIPPYTVSLGTLNSGSITSGAQTINTTFSTNGASGGDVYITGQYGGLKSLSQGYVISTVSNDLGSVSEGFGAQNTSISQTAGGPYTVVSPYDGTGNVVGSITNITKSLYASSSPITNGSAVLDLKAKSSSSAIAATDYQEVLTFIAAANF